MGSVDDIQKDGPVAARQEPPGADLLDDRLAYAGEPLDIGPPMARTALQPVRSGLPRRWKTPDPRQWPARVSVAVAEAVDVEHAHGHGFFWFAAAFGLGAALWRLLATDYSLPAFALPAIALFVAAAWAGAAGSALRIILALAGSALVGLAAAQFEAERRAITMLDSPVTTTVTGIVLAREIDFRDHWRYTIDVIRTADPTIGRPPERVRLLARSRHDPPEIGQTITGLARLSPPSGPAMHGTFDFAFNSYFDGLGAIGFFMGAPATLDTVGPDEAALTERAARAVRGLREAIAARVREVIGGDAGAVAAAMTVSDRRAISEETNEAFRITGLAHILSISGLHMALAAGIMFTGLRLCFSALPGLVQRFPVKKLAAIGAIVTSTAYLFISGAVVSAQRSWIMVVIMLVAVLIDRPALTMRNVAVAAIVIVAIAPSAVTSPGFQMSFAATAALIAAYGFWSRRQREGDFSDRRWWRRALGFVIGLAMTSIIAGLATGIFSAHHFHRMSGYGLIANIAAMPLISVVVMPMGVLGLLAMPFGLDHWPLTAMGWGLDGVLAIAHDVGALGGDFATGRVPPAVTALLSAGLVILVFTRTWLAALAVLPVALAVLVLFAAPAAVPDILISEDGRLVALAEDGRLATNRTRPPSFIYDQWATALRSEEHLAPVVIEEDPSEAGSEATIAEAPEPSSAELRRRLSAGMAAIEGDAFLCRARQWCVARFGGSHLVATVDDPAYLGAACDFADIVVTAIPVRMASCRAGAALYTARTLRQTGALELYLQPTDATPPSGLSANASDRPATGSETDSGAPLAYRVLTATGGIRRPWTIHRYYDWRSGAFVEPANRPEDAPLYRAGARGAAPSSDWWKPASPEEEEPAAAAAQ